MSWKKVKNLFWTSEGGAAPPEGVAVDPETLSDDEFAAFLEADEYSVPADAVDPVDLGTVHYVGDGQPVSIDFQEQYDLARIPNTDEVEQLEKFLGGLDNTLPQASKIAAAQAFLGAVGKSTQDVLVDAERKIKRVHGIFQGKNQQVQAGLQEEQAEIDRLAALVEQHKERMEGLRRELEGVRHSCTVEESRLQAARVFFGHVAAPGGGGQQG